MWQLRSRLVSTRWFALFNDEADHDVAAMMLYEAGCFQLDHPVGRYIPAFRETPVWKGGALNDVEAQSTPMTVKQLMTHTAG